MKKNWLFLSLIVVVAGFVRVPYVFQESVWNDETVYMWIGEKLLENPLFLFSRRVAFHSYGYLIDIATAVLGLFVPVFYASRVATLLVAFAGLLAVYALAKELTNEFGGLAAALLVALNPQHAFFSVRSLTDVYLATMLTVLSYTAARFDGSKKWGVLFGLSVIGVMMARVSGVLAIPIALLFLAHWLRTNGLDDGVRYGGSLVIGLIILLATMNLLFFGSPFQFGGASLKGMIFTGSRTYYLDAAGSIYTMPVFLLALVGTYLASKDRQAMFLALAFITYFLWFSIFAGEKVPRYVLQTVPLAAVLAVFAAHRLVKTVGVDERLVGATVVFCLLSFPNITLLIESKVHTYTGFQELGEKVAELNSLRSFDAIYSQSARQIRAFSGIDVRGLPEELDELANQTNILLQLDIWEYTAPDWAYPLTQEKFNRILAANFSVAHVVQRDYPTPQGLQKAPVGFLLVRE